MLAEIETAPATESTARIAGGLLAGARSSATVDALVVAEAVGRGGGVVLTGDPHDLDGLAGGHVEITVQDLR